MITGGPGVGILLLNGLPLPLGFDFLDSSKRGMLSDNSAFSGY